MPITRTTLIDDDGTGTTGTIINNADRQTLYNQIDAWVGGIVLTPYAAADYYGSGAMTWTVASGNVQSNFSQVVGKMLTWNVALMGTVTSGTAANTLNIKFPGAATALYAAASFGKIYQAGSGWIDCFLLAVGNHLELNRIDSLNFTIDANTFVRFQFHVPLV